MRITEFEWDAWNINHIARHGVNTQEVEEACYRRPLFKKSKDGLYLIYGQSYAGRYLFMVARYESKGLAYIITARNMSRSEQKLFQRR